MVELLVVIAIIGILVALLLPAVQAAREAARRTDCSNRIRQAALACHNFEAAKGYFPSAAKVYTHASWIAQSLPYFENTALHDLVAQDKHYVDPENAQAALTHIPELRCPTTGLQMHGQHSHPRPPHPVENSPLVAHYTAIMGAKSGCPPDPNVYPDATYTIEGCGDSSAAAIGGWASNGIIFPLSAISHGHITDGSSKTMLIGEQSWIGVGYKRMWINGGGGTNVQATSRRDINAMRWIYNAVNVTHAMKVAFRPEGATPYPNNDRSLGSEHPGGAHVAMADGSVHFLSEDVSVDGVLKPMASRASGENYDIQ